MNVTILHGRLVRDPELRYTPDGKAVTQFTLAVNRPFIKTGGQREADFIPIVTWSKLAENCANHLRKGLRCIVHGRIQVRNYENNEGRRIYVTEIVADTVEFVDFASSGEGSGGKTDQQNGRRDDFDPFDNGQPIDISDDDLPF